MRPEINWVAALSDCVTARAEDNPTVMAKDNGPGGAKSDRPTRPTRKEPSRKKTSDQVEYILMSLQGK